MKLKCLIMAILIFVGSLSVGCSNSTLQPGDTVIPPSPVNPAQGSAAGLNNSNNMSNISPLAPPSSNSVYTLLDNTDAPISVFADSKYLYLLRRSENAADAGTVARKGTGRYGSIIEVYDVENASLVRKISDKMLEACSAFTVKDFNLYAFDVKTDRILLFSSSGSFLSAYAAGLGGIDVEKIAVAKNRRIIMKIREKTGGDPKLAILNIDTKAVGIVEAKQLFISPPGQIPEISDFCLYGESTVLVSLSSGRLCLFDTEGKAPVKSCIFPITAGYIEFDGNVLYYSSDGLISLNPGNAANFSNTSSPRLIGRILINNEFSWPETAEELDAYLLSDLQIPFANNGGRHYSMAQNSKYLFFLDLVPAQSEGNNSASPGFMAYRIVK